MRKIRQSAAAALFGGALLLGFFTSHATMSVDPPNRYLVAKSLVEHGDLRIRPINGEMVPPGVLKGIDGYDYSHFNIGQALIFVPPYFVLHEWLGIQSDKIIRSMIALTVFPLNLAASVLAFYYLLGQFGFSIRQRYLGAVLLMAATGIWQVMKEGQEANHLILFYIVATLGMRHYQTRGSLKWLAVSALMMGAAFLTRFDTVPEMVCYLTMVAYLVIARRKATGGGIKPVIGHLALVVLCTLPALIISVAICYHHFGRVLPPTDLKLSLSMLKLGLPGLLLSPGRGMFWYNPILLLSLAGIPLFWKKHRIWTLYFLAFFAGCLLLHAALPCFHGNCNWGPRYLLPAFPLLLIPGLAYLFNIRKRMVKLTARAIVVVSIIIQLMAISLHHNREIMDMAGYYGTWSGRQWTMFESQANFICLRAANLYDSIERMVTNRIPPWPDKPALDRSLQEGTQDAVLYYPAFWAFHLTYYLPTVRPDWQTPWWGASMILLGGIVSSLGLWRWGWRLTLVRQVREEVAQTARLRRHPFYQVDPKALAVARMEQETASASQDSIEPITAKNNEYAEIITTK